MVCIDHFVFTRVVGRNKVMRLAKMLTLRERIALGMFSVRKLENGMILGQDL